jgi:hypothetical protein
MWVEDLFFLLFYFKFTIECLLATRTSHGGLSSSTRRRSAMNYTAEGVRCWCWTPARDASFLVLSVRSLCRTDDLLQHALGT